MDIKERLARVERTLNELESPKMTVAKANMYCDEVQYAYKYDCEILNDRINYLREDLNYIRQELYNHYEGHIPKILGPTAMAKALKALGIDGDYQVQPRYIYASDGTIESISLDLVK